MNCPITLVLLSNINHGMFQDQGSNTRPQEGPSPHPHSIPVVTASSALGGGPCSIARASTPCLSTAWLQPSLSALPVQLNPGSAGSYSFLSPEASQLQGVSGNHDPLQIPSSTALYPSVHGWGTTGHLSRPFYGPLASQYRNFPGASPMEQLYAPSHLQPVASLQLVQTRPSRPGHVHQPSFQDGAGIYLYNHATLTPIPLAERSPAVQTGRAVPVPPDPNNKVVLVLKEVESQAIETSGPASGCYAALSKARNPNVAKVGSKGTSSSTGKQHDSRAYHLQGVSAQPRIGHNQTNSCQLTDAFLVPVAPALSAECSVGSAYSGSVQRSNAGLQVVGTSTGKEQGSQAYHLQGAPAQPRTRETPNSSQQFTDVFRMSSAPALPRECAAGSYSGNAHATNTGLQMASGFIGKENDFHGYHLQGVFPQPQIGENPISSCQILETFEMSLAPAVSTGCSSGPAYPGNAETTNAGLQGDKGTAPDTSQLRTSQEPQGPKPLNHTPVENILLNVVDTQPGAPMDQQPPLPRPEGEGSLLVDMMDATQLPEDLLNEFPDVEQLIASIEPLLPDCLFPPLGEPLGEPPGAEGRPMESCLPGKAVEMKESMTVRAQSQGLLGLASESDKLDSAVTNETHICLPATEEVPIIDLCNSDNDELEVPGSQASGSSGSLQCHKGPAMTPVVPTVSKSSVTQGQKARIVLVPIFQREKIKDLPTGAPIPGAVYIVDNESAPAPNPKDKKKNKKPKSESSKSRSPGERKLSHDVKAHGTGGKRKCTDTGSKNISKIVRLSSEPGPSKLEPGSSQPAKPSSKVPPDPPNKGKRKIISTEGESLQKIPRTNQESCISKPPKHQGTESILGAEKSWSSHIHEKKTCDNVASGGKGGKKLPQKREGPEKSAHTKHLKVAEAISQCKSIPSDVASEKHSAQTTMPHQASPRKGKMKIFIPAPDLLKKEQNKLGVSQSASRSKHLQIGQNCSKPEKTLSKNHSKDKVKAQVNPPGVKGKKKDVKMEPEEALKQIPRSNLALHMMESVHVFYPLGKNNVPSMPIKKVPVTSASTVPEKPLATRTRPLPKPLPNLLLGSLSKPPPSSLSKPSPSSWLKPVPSSLSKPPPSSLSKPPPSSWLKPVLSSLSKSPPSSWLKPVPSSLSKPPPSSLSKPPPSSLSKPLLSSLSKPLLSSVPKPLPMLPSYTLPLSAHKHNPSITQPYEQKLSSSSQFPQTSGWKIQPSVAGKTSGLPPRPAVPAENIWRPSNMCSSTLVKDQPLCDDPSASPPYEGATFIPWRTPPDDLEVSDPITEEQRPIREMMKRRAQKEREEAAHWTSVGRVKFFVEREKEMDISIMYGYPWRY